MSVSPIFANGATTAAFSYMFGEMAAGSKSRSAQRNNLPQETKDLLEPYFPDLNLDEVPIVIDASMVPDGMGAITLFGKVYMTPSSYNPTDPAGIALIGHELLHVQQQMDASIGFYVKYGAEYLGNRMQGMSDRAAYYSISYEVSAYRLQSQMEYDFRERLSW